ncbi:glycerophosphodiester phosphodiesterase [Bacillus sp. 1P06AnD]|uniref:glycerophosphodiester phosphodiesterase n=1 Tax=Bacillus sp. 1P06AnD TaxID=3132208 RepID=UPI0039A28DD8
MSIIILIMGLVFVIAVYIAFIHLKKKQSETAWRHTRIVAHRGSSGVCPENSKSAFDHALSSQADLIELDIQLSKDEKFMVIHDASLKRTSGDKRLVCELTKQELKAVDIGIWKGKHFEGERILSLSEVLEQYLSNISLLVEVKHIDDPAKTARLLAEQLKDVPFGNKHELIIQSFDRAFLEHFHQIMPSIPLGILVPQKAKPLNRKQLKDYLSFATYVNPKITMASKQTIDQIHELGGKCIVWTINTEQQRNQMVNTRADGIATDYPEWFQNRISN